METIIKTHKHLIQQSKNNEKHYLHTNRQQTTMKLTPEVQNYKSKSISGSNSAWETGYIPVLQQQQCTKCNPTSGALGE